MTEPTTTPTARLRLILTANAITSTIGGLIAFFAAPWVSRELGIDHVVLTAALGAGLVGFAVNVLRIARSPERRVVAESLFVSLGDGAWVLGTIVVVATGVLTTAGTIVAILVGLMVADFGTAQLVFRHQAKRQADTPVAVAAA